ncbi:MAG TPA: DUF1684 domain-containing protein [Chitinophagaceae bacterium]|nr:DUF1684 domain-containing protein [Chitinophagaceae bacterium]
MKNWLFILFVFFGFDSAGQKTYTDSLREFRMNYVTNHEVVGKNEKKFMQFFPVDPLMKVVCTFTPATDMKWFPIKTSSGTTKIHRKYGLLTFKIDGKEYHLNVYQSQGLLTTEEYKDYLFIPFTDETSGNESYIGGRYLDCLLSDIQNNKLVLDFNKAYNPYCAYATGYNCPIPPKENDLPVKIMAGEKMYAKKH